MKSAKVASKQGAEVANFSGLNQTGSILADWTININSDGRCIRCEAHGNYLINLLAIEQDFCRQNGRMPF